MKRMFFAMLFLSVVFASRTGRAEEAFLCDLGDAPSAVRACRAVGELVNYVTKPVGYHVILVDNVRRTLDEARDKGVVGTEALASMLPFLGERARLAHTNRLVFAIKRYAPEMNDYVSRLFTEIEAAERCGLDARRARERLSHLVGRLPSRPNPPLMS